jgi:hypothetical protein
MIQWGLSSGFNDETQARPDLDSVGTQQARPLCINGGCRAGGIAPAGESPKRGPKGKGRPKAACPSSRQYSLGNSMVLLMKYRVISASGKSVYSIALVNTMPPSPSSQMSVAVWSGFTLSFQS